jgi:DNA-directed RNA polymerase subunit RPC12/RpoP
MNIRIEILAAIGAVITLSIALPSFFRFRKTVRCPKCRSWFKLEFQGFDVSDKVVGHSSSTFGGGGVGGLLGRFAGFVFGHASRTNADPFIREWGTAHFVCAKCGCHIEIDTRRDRK